MIVLLVIRVNVHKENINYKHTCTIRVTQVEVYISLYVSMIVGWCWYFLHSTSYMHVHVIICNRLKDNELRFLNVGTSSTID